MAFGMYGEGETAEDRAYDRYIAGVEKALGRPLVDSEEDIAFSVREQGGYTAAEAAEEIRQQNAAV